MNDDQLPRLMTRREVADLLRITTRTLDKMFARDELRSIRVAGRVRVDRSEVMRILGTDRGAA